MTYTDSARSSDLLRRTPHLHGGIKDPQSQAHKQLISSRLLQSCLSTEHAAMDCTVVRVIILCPANTTLVDGDKVYLLRSAVACMHMHCCCSPHPLCNWPLSCSSWVSHMLCTSCLPRLACVLLLTPARCSSREARQACPYYQNDSAGAQ